MLDATAKEMVGTSGIGVEFYTHPIHPSSVPDRNDPNYLLFILVMELATNERKPEFSTGGIFCGRVVIKTRLPNFLIIVELDQKDPSRMTYVLDRTNPGSRPKMEMGDRAN